MLCGEGHVGEHVMLGLVHQPAEFLEPGPQLIGDVPPDLTRRLAVGLDEGLADGGGDNRLLRLWHVGQRIAHEVHAGAVEEVASLIAYVSNVRSGRSTRRSTRRDRGPPQRSIERQETQ